MGGKQKRAAKLKRWTAAHNAQNQDQNNYSKDSRSQSHNYGGSGDHSPEFQPIPYEVQRDILKRRQRKSKTEKHISWPSRFKSDRLERMMKSCDEWPTWPATFALSMVMYVLAFFLVRFLIQEFVTDRTASERSALFASLRVAVPSPVYKLCRVVDYLFCSRELSLDGIHNIIFPPDTPEERYYQQRRF